MQVNWRTKILTVALFGVFALGCFLYVRFYVAPKAHGIILFIAPATDFSQLASLENSVLQHTNPTASFVTDRLTTPETHFSYLSTAVSGSEGRVGQDVSAVSYTHLTLPTIA